MSQREPIHDAIAEAYIEADGDREKFIEIVKADKRVKFLSPFMILAVVRIALLLWDIWRSAKVSNPNEGVQLSIEELESRL